MNFEIYKNRFAFRELMKVRLFIDLDKFSLFSLSLSRIFSFATPPNFLYLILLNGNHLDDKRLILCWYILSTNTIKIDVRILIWCRWYFCIESYFLSFRYYYIYFFLLVVLSRECTCMSSKYPIFQIESIQSI